MTDLLIRPAAPGDRAGWAKLFLAYGDFYRVAVTAETLETVWGCIHDPAHVVEALVAERGGAPVGLAHYRAMPSPLRGAKVGEALLARLSEIAAERNCSCIRWITADDNYRARTLYDRVAVKTGWNM